MTQYLLAVFVIACLMVGWIFVQRITQRFARNHPEFGPPADEESGCGSCSFKSGCSTSRTP
jgi:hypothetical protein